MLFFPHLRRARAKSGVKILGATATTDQWNISFESENTKQTVARVTIFRTEQESESTSSPTSPDENEYVFFVHGALRHTYIVSLFPLFAHTIIIAIVLLFIQHYTFFVFFCFLIFSFHFVHLPNEKKNGNTYHFTNKHTHIHSSLGTECSTYFPG